MNNAKNSVVLAEKSCKVGEEANKKILKEKNFLKLRMSGLRKNKNLIVK